MFGKGKTAAPSAINAHKKMAGAEQSGNFGVKPFPSSGAKGKPVGSTGDSFNRSGKL